MEPVPSLSPTAVSPVPHNKTLLIAGTLCLLLVVAGATAFFLFPSLFDPTIAEQKKVQEAFNTNDLDAALNAVDAALVKYPNDSDLLAIKSLVLAQKGSLQFKEAEFGAQAAVIAEQAIAANPNNSEAHRALGYAYEIQQQYAKAHEEYTTAISLDPKNALAVFNDAHAYDLEGVLDKAQGGYKAALALNPNSDQAHGGLGRILNALGDVDGAIAEYEQVYALTKNIRTKAGAAYSLGMLLTQKKKIVSAISYAKEATTIDPNYSLGWYGLGKIRIIQFSTASSSTPPQERLSLFQSGLNSYAHALKLNPHQSLAYLALARLQFAILKDSKTALVTISVGEKEVPKDITLDALSKKGVQEEFVKLKTDITTKK